MSLLGSFNDWISGQPQGTSDSIAASNAAIDAQQKQISDAKLASGEISQAVYDQEQQDYADQTGLTVAQQATEIDSGVIESVANSALHPIDTLNTGLTWEGQAVGNAAGSIVKAGTGAAGNVLSGILKNIPWWVWVGLALYIFIELGGGGFVTRRARERLAR